MNKKDIKNILFVCTGNSCRSIMAEGLLKNLLNDMGRDDIEVSSAGTSAIAGLSPTDKTVEVMKKDKIDVSLYKTSKLTPDLIKRAALILVMEKAHIDKVLSYIPEARDKTYLLKEYVDKRVDAKDSFIPDPIGKPLEIYERVWDMIKESINKLARGL